MEDVGAMIGSWRYPLPSKLRKVFYSDTLGLDLSVAEVRVKCEIRRWPDLFCVIAKSTAATAIAGLGPGHEWAAVLAAVIVVGKVGVTAVDIFLDFDEARTGDGAEVAFIHDMEQRKRAN